MKKLFKYTGMTALMAIFLLGFCTMAWAEYEIDLDTVVPSVPIGIDAQTGPEEDLRVEWEKPTVGVGDQIIEYVYIWNNSETSLNDDDLNRSINDGVVSGELESPFLTKEKSFFANDDYDVLWYLHIKTAYSSTPFIPPGNLSEDVVIGPFNFDNVPPTGTIALDSSVPGQTATTSSVNPVTLTLSATDDTDTVYLGNSPTFDFAAEYDFANTIIFDVGDESGTKTIYAWFEDVVGNLSTPVTLTFELTAGKTMSPIGAVTLEVGATQTFTIQGAQDGETFDWEIIEASPADVASPLSATDVLSVNITGDNEGTFKVRAISNLDGADYTSGTVTVAKFTDTITHTYRSGLNLVPFTFTGTGIVRASDLDSAIVSGNPGAAVSQIFGWSGVNQRFTTPYVNLGGGFVIGDFDLVPGAAYFVQVDNEASIQITGVDYTSFSLYNGLNLMAVAYGISATVSTASEFDQHIAADTGISCSQIFGWDAVNQRFSTPYVNLGGGFVIGNFTLSVETQGYFVQVAGDGTYQP